MKKFKLLSSILLSTVIVSSTAMGFAQKNAENGEDHSVQVDKTSNKADNYSSEVESVYNKDSSLASTSSSSDEGSVKVTRREDGLKNKLFNYSEDYKKTKAEIDELDSLLGTIRELTLKSYTDEQLEKLRVKETEMKNKNPDIVVFSFLDIVAKDRQIIFDTPPILKDNRTLIPLRALVEAFDADVFWNPNTNEVTVNKDGNIIMLKPNQKEAIVNGRRILLDVEATTYFDRTYVPLRFIGESLDMSIEWDNDLRIIKIKQKPISIKENSYNVM